MTEALHNAKPRSFKEAVINLGVKRLASRAGVFERQEVVFTEILVNHKAVHSRRRAEGCNLVIRDNRQDIVRVKFFKIVNKDTGFGKPLTVKLAPRRLAPARIGDS